jgi:carbamoyltransferase
MRVLGVNAIFHDPSAALVVDGVAVAAIEEERLSRRKHGKRPVPFSAWELPDLAMRWCLDEAGLRPEDLDAVAYSFDPALCAPADDLGLHDPWDHLRQEYARRCPAFLAESLPGLDPARVRLVQHHVAHAASAGLAAPHDSSACLVLDGRGERASHLSGHYVEGRLEILATQSLPHSLGLLYEDLTAHLGFLRSSDEYKVMALASYGTPRHLGDFRELVQATSDGGFLTDKVDWAAYAPAADPGESLSPAHADLAASVQRRLEEVLVDLAMWLHERTGERVLTMAGGTALNCVANTVIARQTPFEAVWVQPAAGDAGTSLGAALHVTQELAGASSGRRTGRATTPMTTAALGRGWSDDDLADALGTAHLPFTTPSSPSALAAEVAEVLAGDGVVAWFQGRSEFGPRALGHRSLIAHPGTPGNLERLNDIKGREQFRPIAPLVLLDRAAEIFDGPVPSPYMLFVHDVDPAWRERLCTVVHVDGTARIQTVDPADEPLLARLLTAFEDRTGLPVLVNTSLNTAGRPMVDSPRDALELFGSTPVDLLVLGPHLVRRAAAFEAPPGRQSA